jgi:GTPase SAR1 family protein
MLYHSDQYDDDDLPHALSQSTTAYHLYCKLPPPNPQSYTQIITNTHQEIRTCYVPLVAENKKVSVTIIDTPGQDIFYRMRNYGVSVADMVLLVVSLEDGVSTRTFFPYVFNLKRT